MQSSLRHSLSKTAPSPVPVLPTSETALSLPSFSPATDSPLSHSSTRPACAAQLIPSHSPRLPHSLTHSTSPSLATCRSVSVVWCGVVWCGVVWCGVVRRCGRCAAGRRRMVDGRWGRRACRQAGRQAGKAGVGNVAAVCASHPRPPPHDTLFTAQSRLRKAPIVPCVNVNEAVGDTGGAVTNAGWIAEQSHDGRPAAAAEAGPCDTASD